MFEVSNPSKGFYCEKHNAWRNVTDVKLYQNKFTEQIDDSYLQSFI